MSYLIFGIVVMLVTWVICNDMIKKLKITITEKEKQYQDLLQECKDCEKTKQIEELKSELITQKAMKKNKN